MATAFLPFDQLERCVQLCGCSSDRNEVRVSINKSNTMQRSMKSPPVLPSPRVISALSPAEGFSKLEQFRQNCVTQLSEPAKEEQQNEPATMSSDLNPSSPSNESSSVPNDPRNVGGVGIVFQPENEFLVVKGLRTDSPAAKSGLVRVGDKLMSVNATSVSGMSSKELACALLGPIGTKVMLNFTRGKAGDLYHFSVEIIRIRIRPDSVTTISADQSKAMGQMMAAAAERKVVPTAYGPLLMSKAKPLTFRKVLAARSANIKVEQGSVMTLLPTTTGVTRATSMSQPNTTWS